MATVAFDVQGTLKGYNSPKVIRFFYFLLSRGHELSIWSWGGMAMASEMRRDLNLPLEVRKNVGVQAKEGKRYDDKEFAFDVCIDDEPESARELLSAGKVISVYDIPEDDSGFPAFAEGYGL